MDIESLLNPAGESHDLNETSDVEIYQAVMDAIRDAARTIYGYGRTFYGKHTAPGRTVT